jgi:two-component system nitrate/nitrite response regulator NarL
MSDPIRLLVVDDHAVLRSALCDMLRLEPDLDVVAEAGSGTAAVRLAAELRPDVIILDIQMPGQGALTTIAQLRGLHPAGQVLILSMHDDPPLVQRSLSLGAIGFIHKSATRETLLSAIRATREDTPQVVVSVLRQDPGPAAAGGADGAALSARELEVLALVATALSNRQVGTRLGISEGTVKRHMRNIFTKLGAVSRIDAVNKAIDGALLPADGNPGA